MATEGHIILHGITYALDCVMYECHSVDLVPALHFYVSHLCMGMGALFFLSQTRDRFAHLYESNPRFALYTMHMTTHMAYA